MVCLLTDHCQACCFPYCLCELNKNPSQARHWLINMQDMCFKSPTQFLFNIFVLSSSVQQPMSLINMCLKVDIGLDPFPPGALSTMWPCGQVRAARPSVDSQPCGKVASDRASKVRVARVFG